MECIGYGAFCATGIFQAKRNGKSEQPTVGTTQLFLVTLQSAVL